MTHPEPHRTAPEPTTAAGRLLEHLATHDRDRIPLLFEPDAELRALLPGGLLVRERREPDRG